LDTFFFSLCNTGGLWKSSSFSFVPFFFPLLVPWASSLCRRTLLREVFFFGGRRTCPPVIISSSRSLFRFFFLFLELRMRVPSKDSRDACSGFTADRLRLGPLLSSASVVVLLLFPIASVRGRFPIPFSPHDEDCTRTFCTCTLPLSDRIVFFLTSGATPLFRFFLELVRRFRLDAFRRRVPREFFPFEKFQDFSSLERRLPADKPIPSRAFPPLLELGP